MSKKYWLDFILTRKCIFAYYDYTRCRGRSLRKEKKTTSILLIDKFCIFDVRLPGEICLRFENYVSESDFHLSCT
jgi:hypothetical protein